MKKLIIALGLATFAAAASAQQNTTVSDSISATFQQYSQQLEETANAHRTPSLFDETHLANPYYYPLFAGNTLFAFPISGTIGTLGPQNNGLLFRSSDYSAISWVLAEAYARTPWLIRNNLAAPQFSTASTTAPADNNAANATKLQPGQTQQQASLTVNSPIDIHEPEVSADEEILDLSDFHIFVRRPNFWRFKGSFSTQFMQYYVSDNWYKGGDNHVSMLGQLQFEANYDNKQKITFSNKLEAKLGFQTSPNDEYHKFKTNSDLLRLTNKLGIKAHRRWYYSAMLQTWTQFYRSYNKDVVRSDFMSPFESVLSLGMDYKLEKKRVTLGINIAPAAADLKYCDRTAIVTNHGIKEGKHAKFDLGSTLTANMTLKICSQLNYVTRLYAFYDYDGHVKSEWENTINVKVNKYLSTKLFLYPRFDNNVTKKNEDDSYFQFNEYLSVGLDLNF